MQIGRSRRSPTAQIPTSSMADIAFLLLVFFLVTTVFDEERGLQLVLPAVEDVIDVAPGNVLFLMVRGDGMVEVRRGESPHTQSVRPDDVRAIWRTEVGLNEMLIAAVKTDPAAPYGAMVDVLDALHTAGAHRISLGVIER